jgi:hypothetical protein
MLTKFLRRSTLVILLYMGMCFLSQPLMTEGHNRTHERVVPAAKPLSASQPEDLSNQLYAALQIWFDQRERLFNLIQGSLQALNPLGGLGYPNEANLYEANLLDDDHYPPAITALDKFLFEHAEAQSSDSLQRAILQHDLMNIYIWLEEFDFPPSLEARRLELQEKLATTIRRLELPRGEILHLPDNYAVAAASGQFANAFDPKQSQKPFLPLDLFGPPVWSRWKLGFSGRR